MIAANGGTLSGMPTPWVEWYPCAGAACAKDWACGVQGIGIQIGNDNLDNWLQRGLSCTQAKASSYSVKIRACPAACETSKLIEIPAAELALALGCPVPLPNTCAEGSGGASGAAGTSCPLCQPVGGESGCTVPVGGGGPSCEPASLGKSRLRYAAGGVGGDGLPGATAWRTVLAASGRTTTESGSSSIRTRATSGS